MGLNAKLHGKMEIRQGFGFASAEYPRVFERGERISGQDYRYKKEEVAILDLSVGNLERSPIGPGAKPRRKQMWPQYGMTKERYTYLMSRETKKLLTRDEIKAGWFYDHEYDGLLANHAWEGHE